LSRESDKKKSTPRESAGGYGEEMEKNRDLRTLILAAGKGTRMKSDLPKVMHSLAERPVLSYVLDVAKAIGSQGTVVIVGHGADIVRKAFPSPDLTFVRQHQQLGTGHAVLQAKGCFSDYEGIVVILCGDVPLLRPETVSDLVSRHRAEKSALTVLTAVLDDPGTYGRIVKNDEGRVVKIVEQRDATEEEKRIREINTGIYCAGSRFLFSAVEDIGRDNAQGEYYLTDIVGIAVAKGHRVGALVAGDALEVMGINTPDDLAMARRKMEDRRRHKGQRA